MEVPSKNEGKNNVSYRHLFTFGEKSHGSPLPTDRLQRTSNQFTFLGSGVDLFQASKEIKEVIVEPLEDHEGDHPMTEVPQSQLHAPEEDQLSAGHSYIKEEHKNQDGFRAAKDFNFPMTVERSQNEGYEDTGYMSEPEHGQCNEEESSFKLPDDIFSRPEALKDIANKFVRSLALEQLEEDWARVDGVRDQMRRDFKIRRQKAIGSMNT